jgi:hypothetical protein
LGGEWLPISVERQGTVATMNRIFHWIFPLFAGHQSIQPLCRTQLVRQLSVLLHSHAMKHGCQVARILKDWKKPKEFAQANGHRF